jgi:hypothetical protein
LRQPLKRGAANPSWASTAAAVISALRIDLRFQGLGIGTAALQYLPEWLSIYWPDTTSIMLSVDEENEAGRRSYAKAGWVDLGTRDKGRIGWVRYMKRAVLNERPGLAKTLDMEVLLAGTQWAVECKRMEGGEYSEKERSEARALWLPVARALHPTQPDAVTDAENHASPILT